jgi:hypothetical protein
VGPYLGGTVSVRCAPNRATLLSTASVSYEGWPGRRVAVGDGGPGPDPACPRAFALIFLVRGGPKGHAGLCGLPTWIEPYLLRRFS